MGFLKNYFIASKFPKRKSLAAWEVDVYLKNLLRICREMSSGSIGFNPVT